MSSANQPSIISHNFYAFHDFVGARLDFKDQSYAHTYSHIYTYTHIDYTRVSIVHAQTYAHTCTQTHTDVQS